jgi:hypothetical protein
LQDIGTWLGILQFQSIVAVSINAGVVCFLFESFKETFLDPYWGIDGDLLFARFAYFVMWHVVVHGICLVISHLVPDDPMLVKIAKRRQKYLERVSATGKTLNKQKDA